MRQFLFLLFILLSVCANAQSVKSSMQRNSVHSKKTTTTVRVKTDEQIAIEQAQLWFKEKYVETTFKDPYSYRVVGIKATSVTQKESLDKLIFKVKKRMDECTIHPSERNEETLNLCLKEIKNSDEKMAELKNKTDEYSIEMYNILAKYRKKYIEAAEKIEKYLINEKEYNRLLSTKSVMDESQLNSFAYFEIHLDCYSKNDLGNEVLGRYVFPFTKDGVFVDDKTTLLLLEKIN
ncbi:MAG: hypothetical protein IKH14_02050 [Prevotella sp.]|nr:hypothetical protein [Prevotella sp.]